MILNHLLQSTLFAALAGLLTLAFRKNRAQIRYALWLAASVKFLIPFSIPIAVGSHFGIRTLPVIAQSGLSSVIEQVSQPFAMPVPAPAPQPAPANWFPATLAVIWILGFAFVLSNWYRRWRILRAAVRTATPLLMPIALEVLTSPNFPEPGVYGIFKPILLLPAGIATELTPPQFEAILAHELYHVHRCDNLATAIHMAVEAIFWFHPLVWWLGARLIEERERACDEEVLRQGAEPHVYAEGILKICELYLKSPLPCVASITGSNLRKRIETIMANRIAVRLNRAKKIALAAAGTACLAVPVLIGIWNAPAMRGEAPVSAHSLPAATARFRSAVITPCKTSGLPHIANPSPGRLTLTCQPIVGLIALAYLGSTDSYPVGDPNSLLETRGPVLFTLIDRFNVDARADAGASLELMEGPMLQALLKDRFSLKVHSETRILPMYSLTVAKSGAKLRPAKGGSFCGGAAEANMAPPGIRNNCVHLVSGSELYTRIDYQAIGL